MKIDRKVDNSYRILLSEQIRQIFNVDKGDILECDISSNKIILTKKENDSNVILDDRKSKTEFIKQDIEQLDKGIDKIIENTKVETKSNFNDYYKHKNKPSIIDKVKKFSKRRYRPEDEISFRNPGDDDTHNNICPRCGAYIGRSYDEDHLFIKVNNKFICRNCFEDMKKQIIEDNKHHRL